MPRVSGRGAGLGNELIPWARSFVCAQVVGARTLAPAFGLNKRRYWRHFGTPRYDWLVHRALAKLLPTFEFTEADHVRYGGGDVARSFEGYAQEHGLFKRSAYVVTTTGMWGGYSHVAAARNHVLATLYGSRYAAGNLFRIRQQLDPDMPVVGMHIRMGDFAPAPTQNHQGRFNVRLPLNWYLNIARSLRARLDGRVQFLIASDGTEQELAPLKRELRCVVASELPDADCSDLLALASADLLVCSASSFSAWAAFLSNAPYIWYQPSLHIHHGGYYSIWGHEAGQQRADAETQLAIRAWTQQPRSQRAYAIGEDGEVPEALATTVRMDVARCGAASDLVRYGVIPVC